MDFGEKILQLRKKAGLSQEELANQLDVSRQTVYKWESGNATPEIEKIKTLTKMFNVSFDYLMNDDVVAPESVGGSAFIKERKVFFTEKLPKDDEADIDNGVLPERKGMLGYNNHFANRRKVAIETLKEIGATDTLYLHPCANVAYFYDAEKKVFGFYYTGQIQFVCPIENFIAFEFGGGGQRAYNTRTQVGAVGFNEGGLSSVGVGSLPSVNVENNLEAWAILSYKEGAEIKELKLSFSTMDRFLIYFFKGDETFKMEWAKNMDELLKNLKTLQFKLTSLQREAAAVLSGQTEVVDVDFGAYEEKNTKLALGYATHLELLKEETLRDNRMDLIKNILLFGGIGLGIVVFIVYLLSLF